MTFVVSFLVIVVMCMIFNAARSRPPAPGAPPARSEPFVDDGSPAAIMDLVERDPVAALLKYGDPDTAARLQEQGIDLGALGYKPEQ